jgi:hypothetical protein
MSLGARCHLLQKLDGQTGLGHLSVAMSNVSQHTVIEPIPPKLQAGKGVTGKPTDIIQGFDFPCNPEAMSTMVLKMQNPASCSYS